MFGVREQGKLKTALNLMTWVTRCVMRSLIKMRTCFKVDYYKFILSKLSLRHCTTFSRRDQQVFEKWSSEERSGLVSGIWHSSLSSKPHGFPQGNEEQWEPSSGPKKTPAIKEWVDCNDHRDIGKWEEKHVTEPWIKPVLYVA